MTSTRRRRTVLVRRVRLAWGVLAVSARYVAENARDLERRDWVVLPVVVALFLAMALFAPDALSRKSFLDASPHDSADAGLRTDPFRTNR